MVDEVIANKVVNIERCLVRARAEYDATDDFLHDYTHQDAAVLNILRACEAAIDIAARLVRLKRLPVPGTTADAFTNLIEAGVLPAPLGQAMKAMVSFRNRVTHDYPGAGPEVFEDVIVNHLVDLEWLCAVALAAS